MAWCPNNKRIACGFGDGTIQLFPVQKYYRLRTTWRPHSQPVTSLCFTSDSSLLASGSHDSTIRVFRVKNAREVTCLIHVFQVQSISFSPRDGGRYIVSCSSQSPVKVWDRGPSSDVPSFEWNEVGCPSLETLDHTNVVQFNHDQTCLGIGSTSGVHLYNVT